MITLYSCLCKLVKVMNMEATLPMGLVGVHVPSMTSGSDKEMLSGLRVKSKACLKVERRMYRLPWFGVVVWILAY